MKNVLLFAAAALLLGACHSAKRNADADFEGYWSDSSGMASFEVHKQGDAYVIRNAMGDLSGKLSGGQIMGNTDQGIPFVLTVRGDSARYTIMDLSMPYSRIAKQRYEELQKKEQP